VALLIDRSVRQRGVQALAHARAARVSASDTLPAAAPARDAAPARPRWQVVPIRPETMTFALLILASHREPAVAVFLDAR
jgi:hypothetical protein